MPLEINEDGNAIEMETGMEKTTSAILLVALLLSAPIYTLIFLTITATFLRALVQTQIIALISVFGLLNAFFNIPTAAILYTTWNDFYLIEGGSGEARCWCPVNAITTHIFLSLETWGLLLCLYHEWATTRNKNGLSEGKMWTIWTVITFVATVLTALPPFVSAAEHHFFPFRLWCSLIPSNDVSKLAAALLFALGYATPLAALLCLNVLTCMSFTSNNDQYLQKGNQYEPDSLGIRSISFIALLQEILLLPTLIVEVMALMDKDETPPFSTVKACAWLRILRIVIVPWLIFALHRQLRHQSAVILGISKNKTYQDEAPRSRRSRRSGRSVPVDKQVPVLFVTSDGLYLRAQTEGTRVVTTLSDSHAQLTAGKPEKMSEKLLLEDENQFNLPNKRPTKTVRFSQNVSEIQPTPDPTFSFISQNFRE